MIDSEIIEYDKQFIIKNKKDIILEKTINGLKCKCNKFKITSEEELSPFCKHYFAVLMFNIWKNWEAFQK
jgi:hypothetical protein